MSDEVFRKLIKEELPNIPEDVREDWLLPCAKNNGWPPKGMYWHGVLLQRNLDFWKKTTWKQEEVDLEKALWTPATQDMIAHMQRGFSGDTTTLFGSSKEKSRVLSVIRYLFERGVLPGKPSLLAVGNGFELTDGHHRLLALIQARNAVNVINYLKSSVQEPEAEAFLKTIEGRWNMETIQSISTNHTVWVAKHIEE